MMPLEVLATAAPLEGIARPVLLEVCVPLIPLKALVLVALSPLEAVV